MTLRCAFKDHLIKAIFALIVSSADYRTKFSGKRFAGALKSRIAVRQLVNSAELRRENRLTKAAL
jgi:hypothetical protein